MGVMGKPIFKGFAGRFFNTVGCIKVRFADFQMDDAGAFTLELLGRSSTSITMKDVISSVRFEIITRSFYSPVRVAIYVAMPVIKACFF